MDAVIPQDGSPEHPWGLSPRGVSELQRLVEYNDSRKRRAVGCDRRRHMPSSEEWQRLRREEMVRWNALNKVMVRSENNPFVEALRAELSPAVYSALRLKIGYTFTLVATFVDANNHQWEIRKPRKSPGYSRSGWLINDNKRVRDGELQHFLLTHVIM
jgi:hypothetical protein